VGVAVAIALTLEILVLRWFLVGPPMILKPAPELVERGVAMVSVCGKDNYSFRELQEKVSTAIRWSVVSREKRGECTVWFHRTESGAD
jgi:hypothetical protein